MKRLIGELGLRYRPSGQADLEAHAATLALLARDVADIPPNLLDQAIRQWVHGNHYMPRASDLVELAKSYQATDGKKPPSYWIARGNADLIKKGRYDLHWVHDKVSGQYSIEPIA